MIISVLTEQLKNIGLNDMKYWLSFVEEGIFNKDYFGYIGGRVELWSVDSEYDIDEFRFLTKKIEEFNQFRDTWDLKNVTLKQIKEIKKTLKEKFYENTD